MKYLNRLLSASATVLCAVIALVISSSAPAQPPAKPPELKVLNRFIGTWKIESVAKVSELHPKETRFSGTATNEWVLDGWFQHHKQKWDNGSDGMQIMTYDPRKKTFRSWFFGKGGANETAGDWDEKTKTLTSKGEFLDGITIVLTTRFHDNDNLESTGVAKDAKGKVYVDLRANSRVKKSRLAFRYQAVGVRVGIRME